MRRNRSNAHRTGDVRSTGNERLGSRDDLEHAVMGEIAYEEPFEACGGEKLLLDMEVVEKKNGEMLDSVMSGAFVNFAKTGNPNCPGLPQWDPCQDGKMVTMVFDDTCTVKENLHDELLPLVKQYKPPFHFHPMPADDDEEESGNAWVF